MTNWHIGVAIPARNEEDLLPRCLNSILEAKAKLCGLATVDIVAVADSSTDRTLEIAMTMLQSVGRTLSINAGVVGIARSVAANLLLQGYHGCRSRYWIANTDADCIVPRTWLVDQLGLARTGVEAIAGTVSVDSFDEHGPEVPLRFKSTYVIEPDGSHPHVHGANLGVRADAYVRVGGWKPLETAEDHDLWGRLLLIGARRQSTSRIEVQTSGRRVGRAPHGFADALAAHNGTAT
jgi:glycosyltransferase involved in cell wall biosynthesis